MTLSARKPTGSAPFSRRAPFTRRPLVRRIVCATALAVSVMLSAPAARANEPATGALIREAYDYAFPLFKLSQYRWTALETTGARTSTTLNRFAHARAIATPDDRWANSPIVDALYSIAWIDLAHGPVMIDTPDTAGRYTVLTLIDFYSNTFLYAGHRTTGTAPQHYLLAGPGWQGAVPEGVRLVRAPANDVYVNLRVAVDGPADLAAAHAVQDGFRITPEVAATDMNAHAPARIRPRDDDAQNFVAIANQMLALDPPPAHDRALIERYRRIGICGAECAWDRLPDDVRAAWTAAYPGLEQQFVKTYLAAAGSHGWINYNPPGSKLGTTEQRDYALRALALAMGMGILGVSRDEANYWITFRDAHAQPLLGSRRYRLRLPPGGIPSNAFWSVSLYAVDPDGQFLNTNPIGRYQISSRTRGLTVNPDGSIDIVLQASQPDGVSASNWLPTPADGRPFTLFARAYEPTGSVLQGTFAMPSAEPVQ
ncbi:putative lipoprotein [Burkholderia lata]|uniref:DUF1254 domain-containing protein n=1 Tax=Burkholderia lata (strain ATCC 17760 / DSM 23089 / LMG 22485 / NCIMB 9086 / R18194 / 383) TaxID=482957 RepID=UPI001453F11A|nr:DUF1254 domain-containing protein [Burkholderia lata]VWC89432.1 putative lipoprotein [Burkholderia lata]